MKYFYIAVLTESPEEATLCIIVETRGEAGSFGCNVEKAFN